MACIAGTVEYPKVWYTKDGYEVLGRRPDGRTFCPRQQPYTSVSLARPRVGAFRGTCSSCPCYRGIGAFGDVQDGYTPDHQYVVSFTSEEWDYWQECDFDWAKFVAWKDSRAHTPSSLAKLPRDGLIIDDTLMESARTYVREGVRRFRVEHPGYDKRKRKRDRAAYMRARRAAAKAALPRNDPLHGGMPDGPSL